VNRVYFSDINDWFLTPNVVRFGSNNPGFDIAIPSIAIDGSRYLFLIEARFSKPDSDKTEGIDEIKRKYALCEKYFGHPKLSNIKFVFVYNAFRKSTPGNEPTPENLPPNTVFLSRQALKRTYGDTMYAAMLYVSDFHFSRLTFCSLGEQRGI
jgi:hypothetical protein